MKNQILLPIKALQLAGALSERQLAKAVSMARGSLRTMATPESNSTLQSLQAVANFFEFGLIVIAAPPETESDLSTLAVSYKVIRDGFDSWKIHFMDFIDQFRRSLDLKLVILPPSRNLDPRLLALLASLTAYLCEEIAVSTPEWAKQRYYLDKPWFVSEIQSLKASALLESPLVFRKNNIFVLKNFAERI